VKILDLKNLPILLAFFCLFFSQKTFSQKRDSVRIKSPIFSIIYSEKLEQPIWIEYKVACPDGKASRAGMDFFKVDSVHTSDHFDYVNNIYDKGHLAPAADFNCNKEHLKQSFSYLNCVLQHEKLNRGVWRLLEVHERELAKSKKVSVEIRVNYSKKSPILSTGATVPDSFTKIIKYDNKQEKYFFKNEEPKSSDYNNYKVK